MFSSVFPGSKSKETILTFPTLENTYSLPFTVVWFDLLLHHHVPFPHSIHETTQVSKKQLFSHWRSRRISVVTYGDQVHKGFCHHISVELLLTGIQQSPLSWGEVHSHILKGHWLLKESTYIYRKNSGKHKRSIVSGIVYDMLYSSNSLCTSAWPPLLPPFPFYFSVCFPHAVYNIHFLSFLILA